MSCSPDHWPLNYGVELRWAQFIFSKSLYTESCHWCHSCSVFLVCFPLENMMPWFTSSLKTLSGGRRSGGSGSFVWIPASCHPKCGWGPAASASLGSSWEMQNVGPHRRLPTQYLHFNKILGHLCALQSLRSTLSSLPHSHLLFWGLKCTDQLFCGLCSLAKLTPQCLG